MKWKITKLDRRHNGYTIMKYMVEIDHRSTPIGTSKDDRVQWFKDMRVWLWENYGPGCELDYMTIKLGTSSDKTESSDFGIPTVERWAWQTSFGHMRIYLKSDAEMTFFKLKFS